MIDLFTWGTPNGKKISIALEELGLAYAVHPVDIGKNQQFTSEFLQKSPNNKIPAIVDRRRGEPVTIFESGAILIHLAETTPGGERLLPSTSNAGARAEVVQWLMWQMAGLGPMGGRANRFANHKDINDPHIASVADEFLDELERLWTVLDGQLARTGAFMAHSGFSIADIASYPWIVGTWKPTIPYTQKLLARRPTLTRFQHIEAWLARVGERPAVIKGMAVP